MPEGFSLDIGHIRLLLFSFDNLAYVLEHAKSHLLENWLCGAVIEAEVSADKIRVLP